MTCCIVGLRTLILLFIIPCICPFFLLSTFLSNLVFVKDISATIFDRKFIFSIQNNNDKLYFVIDNQLCHVCSSLYLISLHAINTVIFRNRFLSCKFPFSYLFFNVSPFSFSSHFSSNIFPRLYKIESSYLVCKITTTSCIVG